MEACGQRLAALVIDRLELILSDTAVCLVNSAARARKVSPHHLALAVPGLCHTHGPDLRDHGQRCAYCRRRGNCFVVPAAAAAAEQQRPGG